MWLLYQVLRMIDYPTHNPELGSTTKICDVLGKQVYTDERFLSTARYSESSIPAESKNSKPKQHEVYTWVHLLDVSQFSANMGVARERSDSASII